MRDDDASVFVRAGRWGDRRSWAACGFVCRRGKSWKGLRRRTGWTELRRANTGGQDGAKLQHGEAARITQRQRLLAGGASDQLLRAVKIARRGGAADRAVVAVDGRQTRHALVVGVEEATRPALRRRTGSSVADCLAGVRSEPPPTLLTRFRPTLRARRPSRWSLFISRTVVVGVVAAR